MLLACLAFFEQSIHAQNQPVTGNIYDSQTKQALAGVSIKTSDNKLLTVSDKKGYFKIENTTADQHYRFILLGFKPQEVDYNKKEGMLNIQLDADESSLNEVRVTGFAGNRTKKETAGSIGMITSKDINRGSGLSFSIGAEFYTRSKNGSEHAL
ncbi:carboxypeptidase-like regulatory domain-containing protein [Pedobacter sp. NJ-S-72]